jgi:hypothetical protein
MQALAASPEGQMLGEVERMAEQELAAVVRSRDAAGEGSRDLAGALRGGLRREDQGHRSTQRRRIRLLASMFAACPFASRAPRPVHVRRILRAVGAERVGGMAPHSSGGTGPCPQDTTVLGTSAGAERLQGGKRLRQAGSLRCVAPRDPSKSVGDHQGLYRA